jgi:hypothetical protein
VSTPLASQLVLVKYLYRLGEATLDHVDPMSCGAAVSRFQDAVELCLWTVAKEKAISLKRDDHFDKVLHLVATQIEKDTGTGLPAVSGMRELNIARVSFKHYGNLPDPSDARKFLAYTSSFLAATVKAAFDVDFDAVSLADRIQDDAIKATIKAAERNALQGDFTGCAVECSKAEHMISERLGRVLPEVPDRLSDVSGAFDRLAAYGMREAMKRLESYLDSVRNFLLVTAVDIPLQDYSRFRTTMPRLTQSLSGKWDGYRQKDDYSEDDAAFAIRYVTNYALAAQSLVVGSG